MLRQIVSLTLLLFTSLPSFSQLQWKNVDSLYQPLPNSIHVFFTNTPIDTNAFRAFYVIADLKDRKLKFETDTSHNRRLTPSEFYQREQHPLVVVNGTFFSFETNQNLNLVVNDGKILARNNEMIRGRGKDSMVVRHIKPSAIGITKRRQADVAWTLTAFFKRRPYAYQSPIKPMVDTIGNDAAVIQNSFSSHKVIEKPKKWKIKTAIGGGPVLLQDGNIKITNNEELKFAGKAIRDKHPRTAMGYTADNKLIILVVEGRNPASDGATLIQLAEILKQLGCVEALNLDGGGSSCLLVNGKETIVPSDKKQRAVPAVFLIKM